MVEQRHIEPTGRACAPTLARRAVAVAVLDGEIAIAEHIRLGVPVEGQHVGDASLHRRAPSQHGVGHELEGAGMQIHAAIFLDAGRLARDQTDGRVEMGVGILQATDAEVALQLRFGVSQRPPAPVSNRDARQNGPGLRIQEQGSLLVRVGTEGPAVIVVSAQITPVRIAARPAGD